jgi:hypothetical protein
VASVSRAHTQYNLRDSTQSAWAFALRSLILDVVAVGGMSADMTLARNLAFVGLLIACAYAAAEDSLYKNVSHQLFPDYTSCFAYHLTLKQCFPDDATEAQRAQAQGMIDSARAKGAVSADQDAQSLFPQW